MSRKSIHTNKTSGWSVIVERAGCCPKIERWNGDGSIKGRVGRFHLSVINRLLFRRKIKKRGRNLRSNINRTCSTRWDIQVEIRQCSFLEMFQHSVVEGKTKLVHV